MKNQNNENEEINKKDFVNTDNTIESFATKVSENLDWQNEIKSNSEVEGNPKICGFNFEKANDKNGAFRFDDFLKSFATTGFQATNLSEAIEISKVMQREKATIFLGYTSNMVSSGNRELIKYLVKHKKVDVLVTSAGGIEEDIIKCLKHFVLGKFNVPGRILFEKGINRTGNIFVPNDRYAYFDQFMRTFFEELYRKQKEEGIIWCPQTLIRELGLTIRDEESILYHAAKNNIPVFCPGIIDGSIGDLVLFFKQRHPDFIIDVAQEMQNIVKIVFACEKSAAIILGGGISKHFVLNANIFREGLDYAVFVNTGQEFDGSDSGARIDEAITWGKIKPDALSIKVHCDATIAFPLIVAGAFRNE